MISRLLLFSVILCLTLTIPELSFAEEAVTTAAEIVSLDNTVSDEAKTGNMLINLAPIILVVIIFYFLIIRPQNKKLREHRQMMDTLKKGDRVITGGGIEGVISKVEEGGIVEVEIAKGVNIRVIKSTIDSVFTKEGKTESQKDSLRQKTNK